MLTRHFEKCHTIQNNIKKRYTSIIIYM